MKSKLELIKDIKEKKKAIIQMKGPLEAKKKEEEEEKKKGRGKKGRNVTENN